MGVLPQLSAYAILYTKISPVLHQILPYLECCLNNTLNLSDNKRLTTEKMLNFAKICSSM